MSFSSLINSGRDRLARMFGTSTTPRGEEARAISATARSQLYEVNEARYSGSVYLQFAGPIRASAFPKAPPDTRITPFCSPFREIVDAYQNVLPGTYGDGVKIADTVDEKPVNPRLADPIRQIWRGSNLDSEKAKIIFWAANLGTVGLRPTLTGQPGRQRVVLRADHPGRIFNVEEDSDGNVTSICLKYAIPVNGGTLKDPNYENADVVEVLTKKEFSQTIDGVQQVKDDQRHNTFGFCPYVILRHRDNGTIFGDYAYYGSELTIDSLNYRISQQDKSIGRHMFPRWAIGSGGREPKSIPMGESEASWFELAKESPTPFIQAIVAQINQKDAQGFWVQLISYLRARQPEMLINHVELLANTSGDAIAQALKPAETAINNVKPNYHHGFIRGLQMGLSIGSELGLWDIGVGMGAGSGDKAYQQGLENFSFVPRPALPQIASQISAQAAANLADQSAKFDLAAKAQSLGVSQDEVYRTAGYTKRQIEDIDKELSTKDIVPPVAQ